MSLEVNAVTKDFGAALKALRTSRGWSQKNWPKESIVLRTRFGDTKTIFRNQHLTRCDLFGNLRRASFLLGMRNGRRVPDGQSMGASHASKE